MKILINIGLALTIGTSIILSGCFQNTDQSQNSSDLKLIVTSDGNETISPTPPRTVKPGSTISFTLTFQPGYTFSQDTTTSCGSGSWNGNVYTTGPITTNCTLRFIATNKYLVTPSGDAQVTISPSTGELPRPKGQGFPGSVQHRRIASSGSRFFGSAL